MRPLIAFWNGFLRLFGLNVCTPATPARPVTAEQRRLHERLQQLRARD